MGKSLMKRIVLGSLLFSSACQAMMNDCFESKFRPCCNLIPFYFAGEDFTHRSNLFSENHQSSQQLKKEIEQLITNKGDLNARLREHHIGAPLLEVAWTNEDSDSLEHLLKAGANPNACGTSHPHHTGLLRAVMLTPNIKGVELLLAYKADPNFHAHDTKPSHFPISQAVLEYHAAHEGQNKSDAQPIQHTVEKQNKYKKIITLLLEHGADPYLKGTELKSAIDIAQEKKLDCMTDLLERGAKMFIELRETLLRKIEIPKIPEEIAFLIAQQLYCDPDAYQKGARKLAQLRLARKKQSNT